MFARQQAAVVLREFGAPSVLHVEQDWPLPVLGPGEVLVSNKATAVTEIDVETRRGRACLGEPIALPQVNGGGRRFLVGWVPPCTGSGTGLLLLRDQDRRGWRGAAQQGLACWGIPKSQSLFQASFWACRRAASLVLGAEGKGEWGGLLLGSLEGGKAGVGGPRPSTSPWRRRGPAVRPRHRSWAAPCLAWSLPRTGA